LKWSSFHAESVLNKLGAYAFVNTDIYYRPEKVIKVLEKKNENSRNCIITTSKHGLIIYYTINKQKQKTKK